MPELPEVEVVRRGLEKYVVGRTLHTVEVLHPRAVRRHLAGPDDFAAATRGLTIMGARRRGKYLWLPAVPDGAAAGGGVRAVTAARAPADARALADVRAPADASAPAGTGGEVVPGAELDLGDAPATTGAVGAALAAAVAEAAPDAGGVPDAGAALDTGGVPAAAGDALLAHLGMSGQLLLGDPGRPLSSHVRIRFTFTDEGPDLRFTDQRTFGHLMLDPGGAALPALISHIAPDPMEDAYDEAAVIARLRTRRTGIKAALLDQSLISGIGNIYADEALWRARIHWARPAASVVRAGVAPLLLAAVREVLAEALLAGGTSFDSLYVNVNGESGYFGRSLAVYGREREPCLRCGTPVRRDPFMNRSAYSCPACQPRPRGSRGARDLRSLPT